MGVTDVAGGKHAILTLESLVRRLSGFDCEGHVEGPGDDPEESS